MSEPNYHTTKCSPENLLAIEMKKIIVKMNKPVYLGLSILEISKTLMDKFWYNYIKTKYRDNAKLCYMDKGSFIIRIKTENFYKDILVMLKKDLIHQNIVKMIKDHKLIGLLEDDLGGNIMTEFVAVRPKKYSYLMDDDKKT